MSSGKSLQDTRIKYFLGCHFKDDMKNVYKKKALVFKEPDM